MEMRHQCKAFYSHRRQWLGGLMGSPLPPSQTIKMLSLGFLKFFENVFSNLCVDKENGLSKK
jgi:hypothetical protein